MMSKERALEYLTDIYPYEEAGVMYDGSDGRQLICSSKDNVSAMIAEDEGISGTAWIALDQVHAPYGVQYAGNSKERTLPESYYAGGYDFLIKIAPEAGDAEAVKQKAEEIRQALERWYIYISEEIACGGSRYLIIRVSDMDKSTAEHNDTIMRLLNITKMLHTGPGVKISFAKSKCRMYPLPGTGEAVFIKADNRQTTCEYIREYVMQRYPAAVERAKYNGYRPEQFDMTAFIKRHKLYLREPDVVDGATRYTIPCPWCGGAVYGQRAEREARIIHRDTGEIAYICPTCLRPHTWEDLRRKYEPTEEEQKTQEHEDQRYKKRAKPVYVDESKLSEDYHKYGHYNSDDQLYVRSLEPEPEYIKTGIKDLDQTVGGLGRGKLSVLVGASGSGKSTLLTQITLDAAEDGERVGMTAAEQKLADIVTWRDLIAAGEYNVKTGIANFYSTPWMIVKKISTWLRGKSYINSNTWMNGTEKTSAYLKRLEETIVDKDLTIYIIDNLMSLDISEYSEYSSEYTAQRKFMWAVKRVAERTGAHIILCVHPNKTAPIVTIDNIMGSSYIRAVADEVYIMHKVDNKFRNNVGAMLQWETGRIKADGTVIPPDPRLEASNLIEIAKSRATGITDYFIKMFHESKSKRLKNSLGEVKHYGWEMLMDEE